MGKWWSSWLPLMAVVLMFVHTNLISGEDPYRFYTWNVTYGDIYPLGLKQQVLCLSSLLLEKYAGKTIYLSKVFVSLTLSVLLSWIFWCWY